MESKRVERINTTTNELHDDVANLSEELIDENYAAANDIADDMIRKLRHLKTNIKTDEV